MDKLTQRDCKCMLCISDASIPPVLRDKTYGKEEPLCALNGYATQVEKNDKDAAGEFRKYRRSRSLVDWNVSKCVLTHNNYSRVLSLRAASEADFG